MPGRRQRDAVRDALRRGDLPTPVDRFEPTVTGVWPNGRPRSSTYIRCVLCHSRGLGLRSPDWSTAVQWQLIHMTDHPWACTCGRSFISAAHLSQHIAGVRYPNRVMHHRDTPGM